jgi:hypothetical protein
LTREVPTTPPRSRTGWADTRASTSTSPRPAPPGSTRSNAGFGLLADKLLRRGVHTSVQALEHDIRAWIDTWNTDPRPFIWTKNADEILASLADYLHKIKRQTTQQGAN